MKLYEMSLSRAAAIDRCISLGEKFAEHFNKLFIDKEYERNHHLSEMQTWYNTVKSIKLSYTSKPISNTKLVEWFFTAGQEVEDFIKPNLVDYYEEFIINLLKTNNTKISFEKLEILNIQ